MPVSSLFIFELPLPSSDVVLKLITFSRSDTDSIQIILVTSRDGQYIGTISANISFFLIFSILKNVGEKNIKFKLVDIVY